jgi:hypothetical protein
MLLCYGSYLLLFKRQRGQSEALAANSARSIEKDSFIDWLWEKLEADFGFHPPN